MAVRGPYDSKTPPESDTLGARIRLLRMRKGWTQTDLGQQLNTDNTAISAWERDRAKPAGAGLTALALVLGVTPGVLEGVEPLPQGGEAPTEAKEGEPEIRRFLPELGASGLAWVRPEDGSFDDLADVQSAILRLIEAQREGRKVWIVDFKN